MIAHDATLINRLRVRASDPEVTPLRVTHILSQMSLSPRQLPPTAVLCVRMLRDPLPGQLLASPGQLRPPPQWEQAMHATLDELLTHAERPITGAVSANAPAVLFQNRAELLACLALDWLNGALHAHWWWRGLLRGGGTEAALTLWHDHPEFVPAALALLVEASAAVRFVQSLPESRVRQLAAQVVERYGLSAFFHAVDDAGEPPSAANDEIAFQTPAQAEPVQQRGLAAAQPVLPPWRAWFPSVFSGVACSPAREFLLGIGLTLTQKPGVVRAPAFVRQVREWLAQSASSTTIQTRHAPAANDDHITMSGLPVIAGDAQERVPPPEPVPHAVTSSPPVQAAPFDEARSVSPAPSEKFGGEAAQLVPVTMDEPLPPKITAAPSALGERQIEWFPYQEEVVVDTQYGGLFYLLNAALALELYGDFSMPRSPGIALSPWDLLALLGEWFIGSDFRADPGWALLAGLSGRVHQPPGYAFQPPRRWRLPVRWLDPFSATPGDWRWSSSGGRLRVWHPAGFWVIDQSSRVRESLDTILAAYGAAALPGNVPAMRAKAGLQRWVEWLAVYLRARLVDALGAASADALGPTLLHHPAHIAVTAARIDITLDLNTLPIAVRLAGLDRDPGWIPAAGRTVAFHFEV